MSTSVILEESAELAAGTLTTLLAVAVADVT